MDKSKLNEFSEKGKNLFKKGKEKVQTGINKIKPGQTTTSEERGVESGGNAKK